MSTLNVVPLETLAQGLINGTHRGNAFKVCTGTSIKRKKTKKDGKEVYVAELDYWCTGDKDRNPSDLSMSIYLGILALIIVQANNWTGRGVTNDLSRLRCFDHVGEDV